MLGESRVGGMISELDQKLLNLELLNPHPKP